MKSMLILREKFIKGWEWKEVKKLPPQVTYDMAQGENADGVL